MFYTICYISHAKNNITDKEISVMFEAVNSFNNANKIKGILLYGMGTFFQILEGERDIVVELFYEKIFKDGRHHNIFKVIEKNYSEPIFKKYSSKFNTLKNPEDLKKLMSYLEENKYSSTHNKLQRLLEPFLIAMA